jgi:pimeloyl-ACP methyl ester carboxylesterase
MVDWIESALDELGWQRPHVAGNSMGGYLGLLLAERGRASSLVAFAPSGGWAPADESYLETLAFFEQMQRLARHAAPHADRIMASADGRRRATQYITVRFEHLEPELLAHQLVGAAACNGAQALIERGRRDGWHVEAERIDCPVRIVWGAEDLVLEWPRMAERYREQLPHADWVELDGVGHCPQLDVPLEAAQLILGVTAP